MWLPEASVSKRRSKDGTIGKASGGYIFSIDKQWLWWNRGKIYRSIINRTRLYIQHRNTFDVVRFALRIPWEERISLPKYLSFFLPFFLPFFFSPSNLNFCFIMGESWKWNSEWPISCRFRNILTKGTRFITDAWSQTGHCRRILNMEARIWMIFELM